MIAIYRHSCTMNSPSAQKRSASQLRSSSIGRQLQSKLQTYTQNNNQSRRASLEQQIQQLKTKYQPELTSTEVITIDDGLNLDYLSQQREIVDNTQFSLDITGVCETQSPKVHQTLTQESLSVFQNHSTIPQSQGQTQQDVLIQSCQEEVFSTLKSQVNQIQSQLDLQNFNSTELKAENNMQKKMIESLKQEISQLRAQKRCIQDNYNTVMRQRHDEQQQVARLLQGTMSDADMVTIQKIMFNGQTEPENHAKNGAIKLASIDASASLLTQVELSNKVTELESIIQQQNDIIKNKTGEIDKMRKHISAAVQALQ